MKRIGRSAPSATISPWRTQCVAAAPPPNRSFDAGPYPRLLAFQDAGRSGTRRKMDAGRTNGSSNASTPIGSAEIADVPYVPYVCLSPFFRQIVDIDEERNAHAGGISPRQALDSFNLQPQAVDVSGDRRPSLIEFQGEGSEEVHTGLRRRLNRRTGSSLHSARGKPSTRRPRCRGYRADRRHAQCVASNYSTTS